MEMAKFAVDREKEARGHRLQHDAHILPVPVAGNMYCGQRPVDHVGATGKQIV